MSELKESLNKCRVEGNTLYLPPISEGMLPNYAEVKKALINAGAKYNKNKFVFSSDAKPFVDRLTGGESINIKKELQFYPTPAEICDYLVELAEIKDGDIIMEPSAGQGAIIDAILRSTKFGHRIDSYELMPENREILKAKRQVCLGDDFLKCPDIILYDRIIANPPFSKNQDLLHIRKMYDLLKPGGRLVSVASKHWKFAIGKKESEFRTWLKSVKADIYDIEAGKFKESGTMVASCIIVINKK